MALLIISIVIIFSAMNDDSIGFLLGDTSRLFRKAFNGHARALGITGLQWRLMAHLSRNQGIHQSGLADLLEVEPITLSRMVDRLAEAGMVERHPDPMDRRTNRLFLTDRADPVIADLRASGEVVIAQAMDGISAEEQLVLARLVSRMRANLSRP